MMKKKLFGFIFISVLSFSFHAQAVTVYLKPQEALQLFFPGSSITTEKKTLTEQDLNNLKSKIGKIKKTDWTFHIAKSGGQIKGYALLDSQIGKTEPITFMTALTPQGSVKSVEILVYRENYGNEVTQKGFLNQFKTKNAQTPLKLGKNIKNITGATFSSRALTVGVQRAVTLWEHFYGKK